MDRLTEYVINHSSCYMPRCEYVENDIEIDCDRCQEIMIEEHDAKVRLDAIDEFVNFINTMPTYENEYGEIMPMPIEMMAEQLKENKEWE